jgi:hypothetical protein
MGAALPQRTQCHTILSFLASHRQRPTRILLSIAARLTDTPHVKSQTIQSRHLKRERHVRMRRPSAQCTISESSPQHATPNLYCTPSCITSQSQRAGAHMSCSSVRTTSAVGAAPGTSHLFTAMYNGACNHIHNHTHTSFHAARTPDQRVNTRRDKARSHCTHRLVGKRRTRQREIEHPGRTEMPANHTAHGRCVRQIAHSQYANSVSYHEITSKRSEISMYALRSGTHVLRGRVHDGNDARRLREVRVQSAA